MDQTRQYGLTLADIRADHVKRYRFAALRVPPGSYVLDMACGCGYGSRILHDAGLDVLGMDIDKGAIEHAREHFPGPLYMQGSAEREGWAEYDALVSFETLEHLEKPGAMLDAIRAPLLIASVPNEEHYPFNPETFAGDAYPHKRHYTPNQFAELLEGCGYDVVERWHQRDKHQGDLERGTQGMFLIYVGRRGNSRIP